MLNRGCYPAAITPFDSKGQVDRVGVARLLAWFEACGCMGAVLAGTNGEGPSLSAPEKRDLLKDAVPLRGKLDLILGIATPSLTEAVWLSKQAATLGAAATLVMPPSYFQEASPKGITGWFMKLLDDSSCPLLAYNFPRRTGITFSAEMLATFVTHPNFAGIKDSSGDEGNLACYADVLLPHSKLLYVGDETLLLRALAKGWTGTISGASNVIPRWISTIVREFDFDRESAETKHALIEPALRAIRSAPQPACHKALLSQMGVLDLADTRLPLLPIPPETVEKVGQTIFAATGQRFAPSP